MFLLLGSHKHYAIIVVILFTAAEELLLSYKKAGCVRIAVQPKVSHHALDAV